MTEVKLNGPDIDPNAAELVPDTGEISPVQSIEVEFKGGPLTHQLELIVDGKKIPHVSKAELGAVAGDVLRLRTEQVKLLAAFSVKVGGWEKQIQVHANLRPETGADTEHQRSFIGMGKTLREAMEDVMSQLDAEELDA